MEIFITSDTHAFHKNITSGVTQWSNKERCRQFKDEVEMTNVVATNINSVVDSNDWLIHLGDWSFGGFDKVTIFREMINCKRITLVYGNHDHHIIKHDKLKGLFDWTGHIYKYRGHTLFHYPILSWEHIGKGTCHFFGHCHGSLSINVNRSKDIGVDTNNLKPYHLETEIKKLQQQPVDIIDHHGEQNG